RPAVILFLQTDDPLPQIHGSPELRRLLVQALDQVLGEDFREARDVEDVFLRIDGGQLTTHLVQVVDDPAGGTAHPRVERTEEAGGAGADDRDVHGFLHGPNGNGRVVRRARRAVTPASRAGPVDSIGSTS